jgi:hypothetical protein
MVVVFGPSREGREGEELGRPVSWARESGKARVAGPTGLEGKEWPACVEDFVFLFLKMLIVTYFVCFIVKYLELQNL